jgi:peroxiredoxin
MRRARLWRAFVAIMVILNVSMAWRVWCLQKDLALARAIVRGGGKYGFSLVPRALLYSLDGDPTALSPEDAVLTVYVLFSPSDCPGCLEEQVYCIRLHRAAAGDGLAVVGIVCGATGNEMRGWLRNTGATYDVLIDEGCSLADRLGVGKTPFKLVVDSQGRVLFTDGPHADRKGQERFYNQVKKLLEWRKTS